MPTRRQLLFLPAATAAIAAGARLARAQGWPSRPVKILVGFAAGGNFDVVTRLLAQSMSEQLGQPVVVENRPGAGSNIATEAALRAPPDGYTLLMGGAVNAVNASLYESLPFRFTNDAEPVAAAVRFPNVLSVAPTVPARTVPEFIAYTRANPGKLSQGSSGTGTTQHLAGELFKTMAGVDFLHVPYRGGSQAITDLLGGQVQILFEPLPAQLEHIRTGRIRALAVTSAQRSDALPDLSAVAEHLPGYEASGWMGLCAPKGTSAAVVEKLNGAVNAALADARVREKLSILAATPMPGRPAEFGRLIADETEKWGRVIRETNIRAT